MMYDERRVEIIDVSERLFLSKGYTRCTINDILKGVGIAKGTFYYYFKSKEDVLDAVVAKYIGLIRLRAEGVCHSDLCEREKLIQLFFSMRVVGVDFEAYQLSDLHKRENALFHEKSLREVVFVMAPIMARLVKQGNDNGVWDCKYSLEYMQIFLSSAITLTDNGIFNFNGEQVLNIVGALIALLEKMLNVDEGFFSDVLPKDWVLV